MTTNYDKDMYKVEGNNNKFAGVVANMPDRDDFLNRLRKKFIEVVEEQGRTLVEDDNFEEKLQKVTKWVYDTPKKGLLLLGTNGNGKTTMLRALHKLFAKSDYKETTAINDFLEKKNLTEMDISTNCLLLLDELGAEHRSITVCGSKRTPITDILMVRYRQNALTVIASNLTPDEIRQKYGDSLYDRIIGMYNIIFYLTPSYRE